MERVSYQLERSLPSLELLATSGVFSRDELRALTSKRQQHESNLIRRVALWEDFQAYIDFEEKTEKLRLLRCRGLDLPPATMVQFRSAYTARLISIFERALRKFKASIEVWLAYLSWSRERKMRVVLGRVLARALAMHPNKTDLWILAADIELNVNGSTTAARSLLQRALRINKPVSTISKSRGKGKAKKSDVDDAEEEDGPRKRSKLEGDRYALAAANSSTKVKKLPRLQIPSSLESQELSYIRLAVEYVRMELVFMERLRRRWAILGIDAENASDGTRSLPHALDADQKAEDGEDEEMQEEVMQELKVPEEEDTSGAEVEQGPPQNSLTAAQTRAEEARAAAASQLPVLKGEIVRLAMRTAADAIALPTPESMSKDAVSSALGYRLLLNLSLRRLLQGFPFIDDHGRRGSGKALRDSMVEELDALLESSIAEAISGQPIGAAESAFVSAASQEMLSSQPLWESSTETEDELKDGIKFKDASQLRRPESGEVGEILAQLRQYLASEFQTQATEFVIVRPILDYIEVALSRMDAGLPTQIAKCFRRTHQWKVSTTKASTENFAKLQATRMGRLEVLLLEALRGKLPDTAEQSSLAKLTAALRGQVYEAAKKGGYLFPEVVSAHFQASDLQNATKDDLLQVSKKIKRAIQSSHQASLAVGEDQSTSESALAKLWTLYLDTMAKALDDEVDAAKKDKETTRTPDSIFEAHLDAVVDCPQSAELWERTVGIVAQEFAKRHKSVDRWVWSSFERIVDKSRKSLQTCSDSSRYEERQEVHDCVLYAILNSVAALEELRSEKSAAQAQEHLRALLMKDTCASPAFWLRWVRNRMEHYRQLQARCANGQIILIGDSKEQRKRAGEQALREEARKLDELFQKLLPISESRSDAFLEIRTAWLEHLLRDRKDVPKAFSAFEMSRRDVKAFGPAAARQLDEAWARLGGEGGSADEEESDVEAGDDGESSSSDEEDSGSDA